MHIQLKGKLAEFVENRSEELGINKTEVVKTAITEHYDL